eukprot:UN04546
MTATITSLKHQTKHNTSFTKMLSKFGDNHPQNERAIFSVAVLKINKQEKSQKRILLLTNKALYNIKPSKTYTCQRRIPYDLIQSISVSTISDEFVIHIPARYDYRYKSIYKHIICPELEKLCNNHRNTNIDLLIITKIKQDNLIMITCNKKQAINLTAQQRTERLQTYYALINETMQTHKNYNHYKEMSALNEKIFHKKNIILGEDADYENENGQTGIDDINMQRDGDINCIHHIGEDTIATTPNFNYHKVCRKNIY